MALRLRFTEGDVEYEVDDYFIDILKALPSKVGMGNSNTNRLECRILTRN